MSKVFKSIKRVVKKVVGGVVNVVKKVAKSPIFKTIAIAAAVYFTGGAALGAMGGLSSGAGMLSGAMSGISSAWAGITGAGSALMAGNLSGAASSLSGGVTGAFSKGAGLLANAATSLGSGGVAAPSTLDQFQNQNDAMALLNQSGKARASLPGLPGGDPWGAQGLPGLPGGAPGVSGGVGLPNQSQNPNQQQNSNQQQQNSNVPAANTGLLHSVAPYAVYAAGQGLAGMAQQKAEQEKAKMEYDRYNENMGAPLWTEPGNSVEKKYGNANPTFNARY